MNTKSKGQKGETEQNKENKNPILHHMREMYVDRTPELESRGCGTQLSENTPVACYFKDAHGLNAKG